MRLRRYREKSSLPPFALPRGPRAIGLLLMVAGVGGFFLSRLLFGDQVLWMIASTLVTFGGLAIIVRARRSQPADDAGSSEEPGYESPVTRARPTRQASKQRPSYASAGSLPPLAGRVTRIFRQQGAQVMVETLREDRCILRVSSPVGEVFTAMILEDPDDVDAADVRALYALVQSQGSSGGYLISGGAFTDRAAAWAQGKPLRLISEGEIGDLNI